MALFRRTIILGAGGALCLTAGAGVWRVMRKPETAIVPWAIAERPVPADVRLDAFRHAILAPNPHNRQPWLIRLVGADEAIISCDLDRRLPVTDPKDRQIVIGFGCFLALAEIAASGRGARVETTPFPEGMPAGRLDGRPVARLRFVQDARVTPDPLFRHVLDRRSAKQPFDMARVPSEADIAGIVAAAGPAVKTAGTVDPARVARLRAIAWDAWMTEATTPAAHKESVDLMRIGAREIDANPDGISLKGPFIEALAAMGQLSRESMLDPAGAGFKGGVDRYRKTIADTPAFMWVASQGDTHADALAAGRAYLRANLAATARGIGMHPVSQALQEFPEMAEHYAKLHGEIGAPKVQMLMRLGYGPRVEASPRWPIATRLQA
jgi:hypothetical protein